MKVLVTGAAGYVGSTLTPLLASHGHEVTAVDWDEERLRLLAAALPAGSPVTMLPCTLHDLAASPILLSGVEAVVHLAGVSSDAAAEQRPDLTWQVNVSAAIAVARAAKAAGVRRFLFASTAAICQVPTGHRLEHSLLAEDRKPPPEPPLGVYVRSKLAAEAALAGLADASFLVILVRKGSLFGYSPVMRWDLVINRLVLNAWLGRPFLLHDRGMVWRPIAHVDDAASAYHHLLTLSPASINGGLFAVAERNVRLVDLTAEVDGVVRRQLGRGLTLQQGRSPFPQRTGRVSGQGLKRVGWRPRRSLSDGVAELLDRLQGRTVNLPTDSAAAETSGASWQPVVG